MQRKKQLPRRDHRVNVRVAGMVVPAVAIRHAPEPYQQELLQAKAKYGMALCHCQDQPLLLIIRERNDKLFLACWPDQSQLHALDCPFYSAPNPSGSEKYHAGAITEEGPNTNIQLHHPMLQVTPHKRSPVKVQTPAAPVTGLAKLHLCGLLHHLWESGGLNRWHPGWRRDWGLSRYMIRRVAQSTMIDGQTLLPMLYVPPVWNKADHDKTKANWSEFTQPLFRQNRSCEIAASGLVIGVVRKIEPTEIGFAIRLQHHSEVFFIDKKTADRLASYSRRGWAAVRVQPSSSAEKPPVVIAALRVQATHKKSLIVVEGSLMRVSQHYIPVNSSFEEQVADALIAANRRFVKPLHYDARNLDLPHFILADCADSDPQHTGAKRVAMYVYGQAIEPAYQQKLEAKDRIDAAQLGYGFWKWNLNEFKDIPDLPPQIDSQTSNPKPTQPSKEIAV